MQTQHLTPFISDVSGAAISQWRFIKQSGGTAIQCSVAGEQAMGVAVNSGITAAGLPVSNQSLNSSICLVESGGAIAQDAYVMTDTQGRAVTFTGTGVKAMGQTLDACSAAGQFIRVRLVPYNGVTA